MITGVAQTLFAQDANTHSDKQNQTAVEVFMLRNRYNQILSQMEPAFRKADSLSQIADKHKNPISPNKVDSPVDYEAADSISFRIQDKKTVLYRKGQIEYGDIKLEADYIEIDFYKKELSARGMADSLNEMHGEPIFSESGKDYNAHTIRYNFDTKKGLISHIITKEGEGYLHGDHVKKVSDSIMYMKSGSFTTCDLEHPHYAINFSESKLITGDKIITKTAYLSIEDTPTPLLIPFGVFPFSHKRRSGILIPSYGWLNNRGYFLRNGGYYFAMNDYMDLTLQGDIYTSASWTLRTKSNYYKRYRYKGTVEILTEEVRTGIKNTSSYENYQNFMIYWRHDQDPKVSLTRRFSADVKIVSPFLWKWSNNANDYVTNTNNASINFQTKIGNSFNLTTGLRQTYNINTRQMKIELPNVNLASELLYPLKRKDATGTMKWYERITLQYNVNARNQFTTYDSTLFSGGKIFFENGLMHSVPVRHSLPLFTYFTLTNNLVYNERWYTSSIRKEFSDSINQVITDTVKGFVTNRDISYKAALETKIFGTFQFKNQYLKAIRHMMTPILSFQATPGFGNPSFGYWKSYQDSSNNTHYYSIFEKNIFGGPPQKKSGAVYFQLNNNLEAKIKSKADTLTGSKKISLIENLSFTMGYDIALDSLNFSDLIISGRTRLFNNLVIQYDASFTPYYIDETNRKRNEFLWAKEKKLLKRTNSKWNVGISWALNSTQYTKQKEGLENNELPTLNNPYTTLGDPVDFSVPWDLRVDYNLSLQSFYLAAEKTYQDTLLQTINMSLSFNLTPNWKIDVRSGFDFNSKKITLTMIDFRRDLHCWDMSFNWIPFGQMKGWAFRIGVKANMLQDLKYDMREQSRDSDNFFIK